MTGRLFGVGLGPGDPELITRKAARLIGEADVIAYHSGPRGRSIARSIAAELVSPTTIEEPLVYPVTTQASDHPGGYARAMDDFYDESAGRLAAHLTAGRTVVVLCEGDPLFYGSYMYLHDRLAARFPTEVVPGVTSVSAAAAAAGLPLTRHEDVLTILPGTLPTPELARRLADTQAAAIMKLGRTFPSVREALTQSGRLDDARYVERASGPGQRTMPVADVDEQAVPYFSIVLVPGRDRRAGAVSAGTTAAAANGAPAGNGAAGATAAAAHGAPAGYGATGTTTGAANGGPVANGAARPAELLVVGLGPGDEQWTTPEVTAALAGVDHIVGYAPYLARVPQRAGLLRHASGNTVEVDRARDALELALAGERVAVVSGGDAGVFGMASAVYEAADDPRFAAVPIRVLPGVTAAQAVAARAGAPLGADYAVLSLSDRRKPWPVIERRLRAVAAADLVIAIYNPASRSRTGQVAEAREILLEVRSPDTVVVIGRDVGRPGESLEITTLGALRPAEIDMRCLLLVGAPGTRVTRGAVWSARSVESAELAVP